MVVLLWPVGLLTGGDDDSDAGGGEQTTQQAAANQPAGVAVVAVKDGKYSVLVQAAKLPRLKRDQAYEVWLYNDQGDAKSLGAQVLDANGTYSGQSAALPRSEIERYRFVDVSREPVDNETAHSGTSVLRGRLQPLRDANPSRVKRRRSATRCSAHRAADLTPVRASRRCPAAPGRTAAFSLSPGRAR